MWRRNNDSEAEGEQTRRFDADGAEEGENTSRLDRDEEREFDYNRPRTCPECSDEMIWSSPGVHMYVIREEDKGNVLLTRNSPLAALVCLHCGYTKLYAKRPNMLI